MSDKLKTLSILMDEKVKDVSPLLQNLYSFQELVDSRLVTSIEKVQYSQKYKLINDMRNITLEISFYLQAPYLIGKKIYGIYHIDDDIASELVNTVLGTEFRNHNIEKFFCSDVPTIIYPDKDNDMISALNISDTLLTMGMEDYSDLIDIEYSEGMELGSLLRFVALPSASIDANTAYIVLPKCFSKDNKYYQAIIDSIDSLILCENIPENELKTFSNLKDMSLYSENSIGSYCANGMVNNFEYRYLIENIIYEIGGYLAEQHKNLNTSIKLINTDLLYKDSNTEHILKKIQLENSDAIKNIENIYNEFKSVSDDLISIIDEIQQSLSEKLVGPFIFYHKDIKSILIDLLIKMGDTFAEFSKSQFHTMRNRIEAYEALGGDPAISSVIYAKAVGDPIGSEELNRFHNYDTDSKFVIKKMLDMSDQLKLSHSEKESLVYRLKDSMRPSDKRKLAEAYFYARNFADEAKEMFFEAMKLGDEEAGNDLMWLYDHARMELSQDEIKKIADYGNAEACYYIAKTEEDVDYRNTFKYLVIAAVKGNLKAIKDLGDHYYNVYLRNNSAVHRDIALSIYTAAYQNGSQDKKVLEKMAHIAYCQQDYKASVEYCELASTAYSDFLLGMIYENGCGCSADKKKAYKYYESASQKGYTDAQVCCDRLSEEFKTEEQKNYVSDNTNYSATTYYSGYYSSYYSGW